MKRLLVGALALAAAVGITTSAFASEGGGSSYPVGVSNFVCCALPPPGLYGMVYYQNYRADATRDHQGDVASPPTFRLTVNAVAPRFVWVTPLSIGGASLAVHTILPALKIDVDVLEGVDDSTAGLADPIIGPGLGWHLSESLHAVVAVDVFVPLGSYKKGEVANTGRNYWAIQPLVGFTYIKPKGLNADVKMMWTYNFENTATSYLSGQELIVDYAVGWGLGNGWAIGAGGYVFNQLTEDEQAGQTVADHKGRAFAVGPSVRYDSGEGWMLTAKYQDEFFVRNRADGSALWAQFVFGI